MNAKRMTAYDAVALTGYRLEKLASAFDRVMDPKDWKGGIRALIRAGEQPVVEHAVLWFTGAPPEFTPASDGSDHLWVTAKGYRLGPLGRHTIDARTSDAAEVQSG